MFGIKMFTILATSIKLVDENAPELKSIMAFDGGALGFFNDNNIYFETRLGEEFKVRVNKVEENIFTQQKYLHFKFNNFGYRLVIPKDIALEENPDRKLVIASDRFDNFAITFEYQLPDNLGIAQMVSAFHLMQSQSQISYERIKANPLNLVENNVIPELAEENLDFKDGFFEQKIISLITEYIKQNPEAKIHDLVELISYYIIFFVKEFQNQSGRKFIIRKSFNKIVDKLVQLSSFPISGSKLRNAYIVSATRTTNDKMEDYNILKKIDDFQIEFRIKF